MRSQKSKVRHARSWQPWKLNLRQSTFLQITWRWSASDSATEMVRSRGSRKPMLSGPLSWSGSKSILTLKASGRTDASKIWCAVSAWPSEELSGWLTSYVMRSRSPWPSSYAYLFKGMEKEAEKESERYLHLAGEKNQLAR
jgi:hypothetical protein